MAIEVAIEVEIQGLVDAAKSGMLHQRVELQGKGGFLCLLSKGMNELVIVTEQVVNDTVRVLSALSRGDLNETIETEYSGSFHQLKCDANATVKKLSDVMSQIRRSTESVSTGALEIADGNKDLSSRTEQQAASLQETTSSMEEMTVTVLQNADNAQQARSATCFGLSLTCSLARSTVEAKSFWP